MRFQPAYSSSGSQMVTRVFLAAQSVRKEPTLDRTSFRHRSIHTHTHLDWDSIDTQVHLLCTSSSRGRNGVPGYNPRRRRGPCHLHADRGPSREAIFFLIIVTKQC